VSDAHAAVRAELRAVFAGILPALDPARAVREALRVGPGMLSVAGRTLPRDGQVRLVAIGKAGSPMAQAALDALGTGVRGVVVVPHGTGVPGARDGIAVVHARHPLPDAGSRRAAAAVRAALEGCTARDVVLFLLSGGGSALCEAPLDPAIPLDDVAEFHRALVGSGLDIVAMNTLRKHASAVKGGRLARLAAPAAQATLLVSDVPTGRLDAVASGPTMPDPSTVADCRALLPRVADRIPPSYVALLGSPDLPEIAKAHEPAFARASFHCLLDDATAVAAARDRCRASGWIVEVDARTDDAPVADAAEHLLARLAALHRAHPGRTVAVVAGGELSCPVRGGGIGGRNQHFALHCALQIEDEPVAVLSAGTDGIDGNSPAAGAVADGTTCRRARARGLDPRAVLAAFDSHALFAALGDAIVTGPTGTNVRDVRVLVRFA